jgi:hypothetical protein
MACCSSCGRGGTCEATCQGPLLPPAAYATTLCDGANPTAPFDVGFNDPCQNGWIVESSVALGANARLEARLALQGFWQGGQVLQVGNCEWSRSGRVWVPWSAFSLTWSDAEASGNTSTIRVYARPVDKVISASPELLATVSDGVAENNGQTTFTVPPGATDYMVAFWRNQGLAGPVQVEELNTSGGIVNTWGVVVYDTGNLVNAQAAGSDGWRPVPPLPANQLRVTNAAGAAGGANDIECTIRFRVDLTKAR